MGCWKGWGSWGVCLLVVVLGCSKPQKPPQQESEPVAAPVLGEDDLNLPGAEETKPAVEQPPAKPPAPKKIPEVSMTDSQAATCKVKVGDSMPTADLPNLDDKKQSLKELFGSKLTVVLFWNAEDRYAMQQLQDLQMDVFEPFSDKGVQVVAIAEKGPVDVVRKKVEEAGAKFPQLLDNDGAFFNKVATERLPRVYLLDSQGKILWFDLEYSLATRRNLLQAIEVASKE